MARGKARSARISDEIARPQNPLLAEADPQGPLPGGQVVDRSLGGRIDPGRVELGDLAPTVQDDQGPVSAAGQLHGPLYNPLEHRLAGEVPCKVKPGLCERSKACQMSVRPGLFPTNVIPTTAVARPLL